MFHKSHAQVHAAWRNMHYRCKTPTAPMYKHYGGRGIKVDPRWDRFMTFYEDMGLCPESCTLERIDNDGNYTKDNCCWATQKMQNNNRRRYRK